MTGGEKSPAYKRAGRGLKSIQSAIFLAASALVLAAVFVVTMVSLRYTRSSIFENSSAYTQIIIRQMNQNIDSYITYMDNIASMIAESEDARAYLFGYDIASGSQNELYVWQGDGPESRIREQFGTILRGRDDIRNIGIVSANGRSFFNEGDQEINGDLDLETQEWYVQALAQPGTSVITSSHVQHVIRGERPWVITLSRMIQGDDGETGVVFIDLNYSAISELCTNNNIGERGYVFILDQEGAIVYHPQQQQLYNELQTENTALVMEHAHEEENTYESGDGRLYTISRSQKTGWTVAGCMNVDELLRSSKNAQSIYVLSAVALVAVSLVLSSLIARNITSPIQKLRDSMKKVQEGDFTTAEVEVSTENEIGSLTQSFNVMTRRIEELMEENVHEQEEKRKSELKALQSQINPHFLYNTLDSIIWMAEGKKNEEVVLMTASLARLLRQSINNEDELVSVEQEMEYAKNYLTIQKMRYKDKLEYEIDVEPSIRHVKIIKLVLQPLIENAIYHGLKCKETKGILRVRGYQDGDRAVVDIIDDGVGMDEETLSHFYDEHKVNYRSNGVGVYNVQKRLKLYYGDDYGITCKSRQGEGTVVTVTIPMKQEESHENQ